MLRDLNKADDRYIGSNLVGVLGSTVPSTGTSGPAFFYPLITADSTLAGKLVRGKITVFPINGTIDAADDTSFAYTATADGADSFVFQPYVDGMPYGNPQQVNLVSGVVVSVVSFSFIRRNLQALRLMGF